MRILHLFDHSALSLPYSRLALLAQSLGRIPDAEQDVCLLGNRQLEQAALSVGIEPRWRISPPGGHAALSYFAIRNRIPARTYDLIHCWSADAMGSATLAMLLAPSVPRVVTVAQMPSSKQTHWARMLSGDRVGRTTYLPITSAIRRQLLTHGVAEQAAHVLRPGIDMGLIAHNKREALRQAWEVAPGTVVVALLGDPIEVVNCITAYMTIGLANEGMNPGENRLALVVHGMQKERIQSMIFARHLGQAEMVIVDDRIARPWDALPGCDIAMAIGDDAAGLSLLWAMAAGVPIVGEARPSICEMVEDHHSALLARPGVPRLISHRIAQIINDPQLAWKLKDTARHEAYSLFSRQRYVQALGQVYQQMASNQPVSVPEIPVTGGMRFAGRA